MVVGSHEKRPFFKSASLNSFRDANGCLRGRKTTLLIPVITLRTFSIPTDIVSKRFTRAAIIAQDMEFYEKLPKLFPFADARSWFAGNKPFIESTAFRNSSLQGAYFIIAARSVGLDCGPMSGFDNAKADAAFFEGTTWKSNFICNLGYGDSSKLRPRAPRLEFNEACKIL